MNSNEEESSSSSLEVDDFSVTNMVPFTSVVSDISPPASSEKQRYTLKRLKDKIFSNLAKEELPPQRSQRRYSTTASLFSNMVFSEPRAASSKRQSEMSNLSLSSIDDTDGDLDTTLPIPGRESHTADMSQYSYYLEALQKLQREASDTAFNEELWVFVKKILEKAKPVGISELDDKDAVLPRGPEDNDALLLKVFGTEIINPIHPVVLAETAGVPIEDVITELLYATQVGMMKMRWAPACKRGDSKCCSRINRNDEPFCDGCRYKDTLGALSNIKVFFTFNPELFFVLTENFLTTPTKQDAAARELYALVPATFSGSGFRFSVGCGGDLMLRPALPQGRYRMHCPVSMTENYLVVEHESTDTDEPITLKVHVSDICREPGQPSKTLVVEHGKVHFDVYTDSKSFFVLWIEKYMPDDAETSAFPTPRQRRPFTDALTMIQHPTYRALYADALERNVYEALELMQHDIDYKSSSQHNDR